MKISINHINIYLDQNDTFSNQSKWEFLKYEIIKESIEFLKPLASKCKKEQALLLPGTTKLEQYIDSEEKFDWYSKINIEIENCMITLQKVLKFITNVFGNNTVKT